MSRSTLARRMALERIKSELKSLEQDESVKRNFITDIRDKVSGDPGVRQERIADFTVQMQHDLLSYRKKATSVIGDLQTYLNVLPSNHARHLSSTITKVLQYIDAIYSLLEANRSYFDLAADKMRQEAKRQRKR